MERKKNVDIFFCDIQMCRAWIWVKEEQKFKYGMLSSSLILIFMFVKLREREIVIKFELDPYSSMERMFILQYFNVQILSPCYHRTYLTLTWLQNVIDPFSLVTFFYNFIIFFLCCSNRLHFKWKFRYYFLQSYLNGY